MEAAEGRVMTGGGGEADTLGRPAEFETGALLPVRKSTLNSSGGGGGIESSAAATGSGGGDEAAPLDDGGGGGGASSSSSLSRYDGRLDAAELGSGGGRLIRREEK